MSDKRRPDKTSSELKDKYSSPIQPFETYEPIWTRVSDVVSTPQKWFWNGFIPDRNITLFAGVGGIGKSLLLLYIMAKTTTGERFNAGGIDHQLPKGSVILLSAEDDLQEQIRPKLLAAEADTAKIHYITSKTGKLSKKKKFIELDRDLHFIEQKIKELKDVRLIVIDPIQYFLGEIKEHINFEVANFLQSLIDLAKTYDIAIVFNKHLRKQASGAKGISSAVSEVGGAGAWTNTPRKCWLITNHHENHEIKIITQLKDNLSKGTRDCLAYKIIPTTTIEIDQSLINSTTLVWLDQTLSFSSDEAVSKDVYEKSKLDIAIDLIVEHIKINGQSLLMNIEQSLLKKGVKKATFTRAYPEFEKLYAENLIISYGLKRAKMYQFK